MRSLLMLLFGLTCFVAAGCGNDPVLDALGLSRCACPAGGHCPNCKCRREVNLEPKAPEPAAPEPRRPLLPRRPCPGPGPCPACLAGTPH